MKRRGETEADEDDMASRLQLDLGTLLHVSYFIYSSFCPERDSLARKSARSGQKGNAVDNFRGVSFDDWLRLIIQVSHKFSCYVMHIIDWKAQYCFVLTKQEQYETADEILRHIMVSNAYQARERQDSIRLALISERFGSLSISRILMRFGPDSLCHCRRTS